MSKAATMRANRAHAEQTPSMWRDILSMTKPSITGMCVLTAAGGYWLVPGVHDPIQLLWLLFGTTLIVGGSCMLNMYVERDNDRLMKRTAKRPLPSGRIAPAKALFAALTFSVLGFVILAVFVNLLTALLALSALISYVFVYTPLKRKTWAALLVGTIPGAMPPLMGWTAATNEVQLPGLLLFAILVIWQLPHFLALSMMCRVDYEKAGIKVLPSRYGDGVARLQALGYTLILLPVSLSLVPLRLAGMIYFFVALAVGSWFLLIALRGLLSENSGRWSHRLFFASLLYLPILTLGLVADLLLL